jgi:hypothetical protein
VKLAHFCADAADNPQRSQLRIIAPVNSSRKAVQKQRLKGFSFTELYRRCIDPPLFWEESTKRTGHLPEQLRRGKLEAGRPTLFALNERHRFDERLHYATTAIAHRY